MVRALRQLLYLCDCIAAVQISNLKVISLAIKRAQSIDVIKIFTSIESYQEKKIAIFMLSVHYNYNVIVYQYSSGNASSTASIYRTLPTITYIIFNIDYNYM